MERLSAEKNTGYSLWKATKNLKKQTRQIPPIRRDDSTQVRNNEEKVNLLS